MEGAFQNYGRNDDCYEKKLAPKMEKKNCFPVGPRARPVEHGSHSCKRALVPRHSAREICAVANVSRKKKSTCRIDTLPL
ncbi:hypothetical protein Y032_0041g358 [Ancylostoma ceylanicum]|uniref:Uncharacterized protein n=1 Tax=Ancylostoma ceylanicum TaxID=53326 RepID=A0A016UGU1_9BILA|nr:hypothetical protein Y032_0041g358 [Ancylostoma ceylanicum]